MRTIETQEIKVVDIREAREVCTCDVDDRNTKAVQIEHETVLCYDDGRTNA